MAIITFDSKCCVDVPLRLESKSLQQELTILAQSNDTTVNVPAGESLFIGQAMPTGNLIYSTIVAPDQAVTINLRPGLGGLCVFGTGDTAVTFIPSCPVQALSLDEFVPGTVIASSGPEFLATSSATVLVSAGRLYNIRVETPDGATVEQDNVPGGDIIAGGTIRYTASEGGMCVVLVGNEEFPLGTAVIPIQNQCPGPVVVTVAGQLVTIGFRVTKMVPVTGSVVAVCVGSRCVTSPIRAGLGRPVLITTRTGFCAPTLDLRC